MCILAIPTGCSDITWVAPILGIWDLEEIKRHGVSPQDVTSYQERASGNDHTST